MIETHPPILELDHKGRLKVMDFGKLVPDDYDYIELVYAGNIITAIIYKRGGATGELVATVTLIYVAGKLNKITKT